MKTDFYTKAVLTVIAVCLIVIALNQVDIIPRAYAESPDSNLKPYANYGLVPLNEDGSVDVKIVSGGDKIDVNIEEVGGYWFGGSSLPVKIED